MTGLFGLRSVVRKGSPVTVVRASPQAMRLPPNFPKRLLTLLTVKSCGSAWVMAALCCHSRMVMVRPAVLFQTLGLDTKSCGRYSSDLCSYS